MAGIYLILIFSSNLSRYSHFLSLHPNIEKYLLLFLMSHVFHFCHIILETSTSTVDDRSGVGGTKRGNTELKLQKNKNDSRQLT